MEFTKYPVDENGLILYPDDSEWRRSIFPEKVFRHPAKANLHIISDVVDYTTEPGDTVMDIMAGTGSIMIAAMRDRRVVCIELEEGYQKLLFEGRQRIEELYPDARDIITILCGDCRDFLPIPVNHILFSPPYCLAPDTPILTWNLEWKNLGDINQNDELVGIDKELLTGQKYRNIRKSQIVGIATSKQKPYIITLSDGRKLTSSWNHRWLASPPSSDRLKWISTCNLTNRHTIRGIVRQTWETADNYNSGYIAGLFDGEGWIRRGQRHFGVGFRQKEGQIADAVLYYLVKNNYHVSSSPYKDMVSHDIFRVDEAMRFIGTLRPIRLLPQFLSEMDGRGLPQNNRIGIESIELCDKEMELIDLQTTTGTFIANGIISHNSGCMNIRKVRKQKEGADDYLVEQDRQMMEYSKHPRNLSKLNTFLYNQTMERIYKLCWQSILPGGTLTIIIKDRIENGERVYLSKWVDKVCRGIGFTLFGWFKWKAPGSGFTNIARSQGRLVVDDEDIILYRKGSNPNDDWEKAEQQVQDYMDWKFRHEEEATCRNER